MHLEPADLQAVESQIPGVEVASAYAVKGDRRTQVRAQSGHIHGHAGGPQLASGLALALDTMQLAPASTEWGLSLASLAASLL